MESFHNLSIKNKINQYTNYEKLMQKDNYRELSVNGNFEANVVDIKILAGAGDTWQVYFA